MKAAKQSGGTMMDEAIKMSGEIDRKHLITSAL